MTVSDDYSDIGIASDSQPSTSQPSTSKVSTSKIPSNKRLSRSGNYEGSFRGSSGLHDNDSIDDSASPDYIGSLDETGTPILAQPRRHKKNYPIIPEEDTASLEAGEYVPQLITVKNLMNAGAHFGHQADKWNPKMLPFIFTERKGIHIINLDITIQRWAEARRVIVDSVSRGGTLLFVGTKQQARASVARHAKRCSSFFTTRRWLGGTLTNFSTIRKSIDRMKRLEDLLNQASSVDSEVKLNKKERLTITRELETLEGNIGGIRNMRRVPDVIFVIDLNKEHIAVAEAKRLGVTVIALVDTNVDPGTVDYAIPCNDDSTRAIDLLVASAADAVLEGLEGYESYKRENPRREESDFDAAGKSTDASARGGHGRRGDRQGGSSGKSRNSSSANTVKTRDAIRSSDVARSSDTQIEGDLAQGGDAESGTAQSLNDEGEAVATVSV